jgi:DNA polymerase III alpha subunit
MAAVLANWGGYYGQRVYLMESRRLGLEIRPPHVNYARHEFSTSRIDGRPVLFMGLNQVRDLTRRTQARIIRLRPFSSFMDLIARVDPRPQEVENLVRCGALQGMGSVPGLLQQIKSGGWRGGQLSLFSMEDTLDDWSVEQKATAQEAILGVSVIAHPLELHAPQIAASHAISTLEAAQRVGQHVRVAGMRQTFRRSRTTHQAGYLYYMSLEDLEGMLDVLFNEDVYRRYRKEFRLGGPYLIEGLVDTNPVTAEPIIRAERISSLLAQDL